MARKIYLSTSWKNRVRVRMLAEALRERGHEVYDFTDSRCRDGVPEIPPEAFPEQFDPDRHIYAEYIGAFPHWRAAVMRNRKALEWCDLCVLLLPAGNDATADWAYAVGCATETIVVGAPHAGERTPTHLWANALLPSDSALLAHLDREARVLAQEAAHGR